MNRKFRTAAAAALAIAAALASATVSQGKIWLPQILSDHSVLQRDSDVNLWGKAAPSSRVDVRVSWSKDKMSVTSDKDGNWLISVRTPEGSYTPHTVTIGDKDGTVTLSDILIGDVWLCGGQSNMDMPLKGFGSCPVEGAMEDILNSGSMRDRVRAVKIPKTGEETPQDTVAGVWQVSCPRTTGDMTATGWYFGTALNAALDVPIGLVSCSWGGSAVESWLPREIVYSYPENTIVGEKYSPGKLPYGWYHYNTPIVMYNGMIHPIRHYTLKGFIWYQGETNVGRHQYYAERLATMVKTWRELWGQGDLPFYEVELAPYFCGNARDIYSALLREAQHKAVELIPNSGCISTNDLVYPYEYDQVHPCMKRQVGRRLAALALNRTYGMSEIPCSGPTYKEMKTEGGEVTVYFDNVSGGLSPWHDLEGFEIAGEDRVFHPAKAERKDDKSVILRCDEVPAPVAVRYCFRNFQIGNLTGELGLPAVPFRTDNW